MGKHAIETHETLNAALEIAEGESFWAIGQQARTVLDLHLEKLEDQLQSKPGELSTSDKEDVTFEFEAYKGHKLELLTSQRNKAYEMYDKEKAIRFAKETSEAYKRYSPADEE